MALLSQPRSQKDGTVLIHYILEIFPLSCLSSKKSRPLAHKAVGQLDFMIISAIRAPL